MILASAYKDKNIAVFGLARTGRAAVDALLASGAHVHAWDDNPVHVGLVGDAAVDLYSADFSQLDGLMLAPGVPLTHPAPHVLVDTAQSAGVPIFGDGDIFQAARTNLPVHKLVAVTGTNGKSTTATLIDHMVRTCGLPSALGGNIGRAILSLDPLKAGGVYVFELSSYQIDLSHKLDPNIAVLLNISSDHLDRHGGMEGYKAAKARLFELQKNSDRLAVIGVDEEPCRKIADSLKGQVIRISVMSDLSDGISLMGDELILRREGEAIATLCLKAAKALQGVHNAQNAAAAWAVGRSLGLADSAIQNALETFPGLEHRQELVGNFKGVTYVNDSKATNIDAAARALASFDNIHWIAGGRGKGETLDPILPYLSKIKKAWLIGEDADRFMEFLEGRVPCEIAVDMGVAIQGVAREAVDGDTVILSPGCAAFDQFPDFEVRGNAFKDGFKGLQAEGIIL